MLQILINLLIFLVWAALSAALVYGIHWLDANTDAFSATAAVLLWLAGQAVLLSPLIAFAWRKRRVGAEPR